MARVLWMSILTRHLVMTKSIICQCLERGCIQVVLRSSFCLNIVFINISSNSEHRASRKSPLELHFPIPCLPMTKGHLPLSLPILALKFPISSRLSVRGMSVSTLASWLIDNCSEVVLAQSLIVTILSLTGRDISVSFVTISFLIAKPTPASLLSPSGLPLQKKEYSKLLRLPGSENFISHRAAISMLYLASSIAISAVCLSGRSSVSRSKIVLTFHCAMVSSCLLLLLLPSCFPLSTEDEVE